MRRLSIAVTALFVTGVVVFFSSFLVLDNQQHAVYFYTVKMDDRPVGGVKVDRYTTEDKRIYKSSSEMPFGPGRTERKARLDLTKDLRLDEYREESAGPGAEEHRLIRNNENVISFLSSYDSRFSYLERMPVRRDVLLFKEDSVITYIPFIESYDFEKGRSQGFSSIISFDNSLPPIPRYLTVTSIKDEYLKVDGRRVKSECLLLKMRGYPLIIVWVSKQDRSIILIEVPSRSLKIQRTFTYKGCAPEPAEKQAVSYVSKEVVVKDRQFSLAGTLTLPGDNVRARPVLLVPEEGPFDRDCQGIFAAIADRLSRDGFAVLRYDRRGAGASSGGFGSLSDEDELAGARSMVEFLAGQKEVDGDNLVLIGFSKGASLAARIASDDRRVRACVLMAPSAFANEELSGFQALRNRADAEHWPEEYLKIAIQSRLDAAKMANDATGDWRSVMARRCYVRKVREEFSADPLEAIRNVKVPVLIVHGTRDAQVPSEQSKMLDSRLGEAGNASRELVLFDGIDHYFGRLVFDGKHAIVRRVDALVLDTIANWMKRSVTAREGAESPVPERPGAGVPAGDGGVSDAKYRQEA